MPPDEDEDGFVMGAFFQPGDFNANFLVPHHTAPVTYGVGGDHTERTPHPQRPFPFRPSPSPFRIPHRIASHHM